MSDYLCIRLNSTILDESSVISWAVLSAAGNVQAAAECYLNTLWDSLASEQIDRQQIGRTFVLVPAHAALMTQVEVPAGQRRHLRQVLPFMVEEQLIEPVESMHMVTPVLLEEDTVPVTVVAKSQLATWLDWLAEIELAPDYLFLDATCLPDLHGKMQVMVDGGQVLIRAGRHNGLSMPVEMASSVLALAVAKVFQANDDETLERNAEYDISDGEQENEEHSVALLQVDVRDQARLKRLTEQAGVVDGPTADETADQLVDDDSDISDSTLDNSENAEEQASDSELADKHTDQLDRLIRSENITTQRRRYSETATELLAVNVVRSIDQQLNLLQGDFRPANANAQTRRIVRLTSLAVAACVGVFLIITLAGGSYLNWQADRYFDKSVAIYKEVFPKQRRVRSPVKEMKRKLSGQAVGATSSEFLPLLDAASSSLSTLSEQNAVQASIQQLRYDMQRGNIAIDIHTDNIDQLESYKDLLLEQGLNVDILSANQDGEIVKGRIQIGRG